MHCAARSSAALWRLPRLLPSNGRSANAGCLAATVSIQRRFYGGRDSQAPRNKWFLVFPAVCFGLGTWQIYRRRWKLDLIESLTRRTAQAPIVVPPGESAAKLLLPRLAELEYSPVTLTGEFDHSAEVLIGPRHLVEEGGSGSASLMSSGSSGNIGYHVVTPLRLAGVSERVLVNRGWVPARFADPATRPQGQTPGRVTVTGLVRHSEPASVFLGGGGGGGSGSGSGSEVAILRRSARTCRLRRDVESLSQELGTLPVFIDANRGPGDAESGHPIAGQTRLSVRNEHLSYVATWFSLGALLSALWVARVR